MLCGPSCVANIAAMERHPHEPTPVLLTVLPKSMHVATHKGSQVRSPFLTLKIKASHGSKRFFFRSLEEKLHVTSIHGDPQCKYPHATFGILAFEGWFSIFSQFHVSGQPVLGCTPPSASIQNNVPVTLLKSVEPLFCLDSLGLTFVGIAVLEFVVLTFCHAPSVRVPTKAANHGVRNLVGKRVPNVTAALILHQGLAS